VAGGVFMLHMSRGILSFSPASYCGSQKAEKYEFKMQ